jgi:hypothetical protein
MRKLQVAPEARYGLKNSPEGLHTVPSAQSDGGPRL